MGLGSEEDSTLYKNCRFRRHIEKTGVSMIDDELSSAMRIFKWKEGHDLSFPLSSAVRVKETRWVKRGITVQGEANLLTLLES